MNFYRKKPVVIEAVHFDGTKCGANYVLAWIGAHGVEALRKNSRNPIAGIVIPTLEGDHLALPGDWIIKGVKGEFYPCKPDIFAATYEPAVRNEAAPA
ncbi:hypothetical protein [Pararhodobacter sp.]|uniref:hypothetical protein n=1 Tax=Pararhodobacter sp. TaxID=2127056 RepID=UPI002FDE2506